MDHITSTEEETHRIARDILENSIQNKERPTATVLALSGDLGSGKTTFVKGVANALGITTRITSPTFVIERRYPISFKNLSLFIHCDAYRLESGAELEALGWTEDTENAANIICIEWPENVSSFLPEDAFYIYFDTLSETERRITYTHVSR